jgi:hypothetical protein
MAATEASGSSTVANLAREQLDELDSLIQQMLDIPVNPSPEFLGRANSGTLGEVDTSPPSNPENHFSDPNTAPSVSEQLNEAPEILPSSLPDKAAWESLSSDVLEKDPEKEAYSSVVRTDVATRRVPRKRRSASGGGIRLPLVWVNRLFDWSTLLLGPLGRGLRSHAGRALLGWIGVLLIGGATLWGLLDWLGWIW